MPSDDLKAALAETATFIELRVAAAVAALPGRVPEAMQYAVRGGKALRGFLVLEGAALHDVSQTRAGPAAAAIECLHAYSLVHDDLPCMDDDDLRRGLPTVHRKWDEATAVLTGDALQALAFEKVSQTVCSPKARVALVLSLARAAGVRGMVGGQALDMAAEASVEPLTLSQVEALQRGKTGALLTWAATAGARMAEADVTPFERYGEKLGLAFQIWDDVLDVEGSAEDMGKAVGKDADRGKATFVSLLGIDEAKRRANTLISEACDALSSFGDKAGRLQDVARFVIARRS